MIQNSFSNMKEDRQFSFCRYYKGEKKNPYPSTDMDSTYWQLEYMWFNDVDPDDDSMYINQLFLDYPHCFDFLDVPTSLAAFLYDQYRQSGSRSNGFDEFLDSFINSHKKTP